MHIDQSYSFDSACPPFNFELSRFYCIVLSFVFFQWWFESDKESWRYWGFPAVMWGILCHGGPCSRMESFCVQSRRPPAHRQSCSKTSTLREISWTVYGYEYTWYNITQQSIVYDNTDTNTKYCVQQMLHEELEKEKGKQLLAANTLRRIWWVIW